MPTDMSFELTGQGNLRKLDEISKKLDAYYQRSAVVQPTHIAMVADP